MPKYSHSAPRPDQEHQLLVGDSLKAMDSVPDSSCRLVITSPPYNIGKEYERHHRHSFQEYVAWMDRVIERMCRKVSIDGHLCLQVGNYVSSGEVFPLDYFFYPLMRKQGFRLRNRIIWQFNFGLHARRRFSGRYETLLWFTRSDNYFFQLDPVRIPQLYPGKRHPLNRATNGGNPSGNPKGKNPTDFWEFDPKASLLEDHIWRIPNVKANHPEKTNHPCQFPSELVERCILALTKCGDTVLDPFVGVGTTVVAAAKHNRKGIGIDRSSSYIRIARKRLKQQQSGGLVTRPFGKPVRQPQNGERVATVPSEWLKGADYPMQDTINPVPPIIHR